MLSTQINPHHWQESRKIPRRAGSPQPQQAISECSGPVGVLLSLAVAGSSGLLRRAQGTRQAPPQSDTPTRQSVGRDLAWLPGERDTLRRRNRVVTPSPRRCRLTLTTKGWAESTGERNELGVLAQLWNRSGLDWCQGNPKTRETEVETHVKAVGKLIVTL